MARSKDADWLTPSEMTLVTPSESFIHRGGVDIKWNGPDQKVSSIGGVWILNGMAQIAVLYLVSFY